jgi:predicted RNA-binding protein with PIN domain
MSLHIIIDGYNLIRQSFRWRMLEQQDMQLGREALLEDLATYKKKTSHRITVVFDAADAPSFMQHQGQMKGIGVKFSRPGESADTVIRNMTRQYQEKALVVSSDREVANWSSQNRSATISSPEFEEKITQTLFNEDTSWGEEASDGWKPTTQKKGPSRRLPKRARKNLSKLRKL